MTIIQTYKRFLTPLLQRPLPYIKSFLLGGSDGIYTIFSLEIFRKFLVLLQNGDTSGFEGLLWIYFLGSLVYLIFFQFITPGWGWPEIAFGESKFIIRDYLAQFIQSENSDIEKIGTGKFLTVLERGVRTWMDLLYDAIEKGSSMVIILVYGFYWIFSVNVQIGFIAIGLIIISLIVATKSNIRSRHERKKRVEVEHEMSRSITRILMSKNEMLQNSPTFFGTLDAIDGLIYAAKKLQVKVQKWVRVITSFPLFLVVLLRIALYIFLAKFIFGEGMPISEVAVFLTVITLFEKNLNSILQLTRELLRDFVHVEKLWDIFDELHPIKGYESGNLFTLHPKDITLDSISYGYNESKVFSDFSLTIKRGQKTALVGASGGGKTTLMKLIAGYLHPESGSISVMGNILSETALKTYYPHIGYLTQDPSVFDATIRENLVSAIAEKRTDIHTDIREDTSVMSTKSRVLGTTRHPAQEDRKTGQDFSYGRNDGKLETTGIDSAVSSVTVSQDEMLKKALKLAHCDFVFEMEKGLDTEIGERGVRLSGGQKQRLAIAKIFLKDPEIILLDEPTSALDSFSEEKITEALDTLFRDRTVIIVAHRLQTVRKADEIIVIEAGQVVEKGDHETLVANGGIYARMLELQSGF